MLIMCLDMHYEIDFESIWFYKIDVNILNHWFGSDSQKYTIVIQVSPDETQIKVNK